MPLVERVCEKCGKGFSAVPSVVAKGHGRFCSKSCARFRSAMISCTTCGDEFLAMPCQIRKGRKFCSRWCKDHRNPEEFWLKLLPPTMRQCHEWSLSRDKDGYGKVKMGGENLRAHRVAFELYWGVALPNWLDVLHDCPGGDNPPCCNPEHLWIGTNRENVDDMVEKERHAFGSRNGGAKLNEDQVKEIREKWNTGQFKEKQLAATYGVSLPTIVRIKRGTHWSKTAPIPAIRFPKNRNHPRARLTDARVEWIRQRYSRGDIKQVELARLFGVSANAIRSVIVGRTWRHLL